MINYFKKFSIMFVISLILVLGCSVSAFATDDVEIGKTNLNGTTDNSATLGVQLQNPEKGWKRYDDKKIEELPVEFGGKVLFNSDGDSTGKLGYYKKTYTYFGGEGSTGEGSYLKFNFRGSKIRIVSEYWYGRSNNVLMEIDGIKYRYNTYNKTLADQVVAFEKIGLENKDHTVKISIDAETGTYNVDGRSYKGSDIDAIDIDDNGELLKYKESITLDKSTMDLTEGNSGQLTATTTPAVVGVTWTSSDSSIATVDSNGNVTAVKEGQATITATTTDGSNLSASSDTSIATVDSNGKVTTVKEGTCTITATTNDGSNLSALCTIIVTAKATDPNPEPTNIVNIARAKGDNTNNASGEVTIIYNGLADTQLSVIKTADVKSVFVGDTFTYTIVVTNTGSKIAKAVVINDSAPNHIDFTVSGVTTTQGKVDLSSTSKNIIVNVGDIPPSGIVTIKIPATVIL